jgi:hypothetical protein
MFYKHETIISCLALSDLRKQSIFTELSLKYVRSFVTKRPAALKARSASTDVSGQLINVLNILFNVFDLF